MQHIHIKNLEKYHPGYKDRTLQWAKVYFNMVCGDPEFELIPNETDKWRFVAMICLELRAQKPLPLDDDYFRMKGFDTKKRSMSLTIGVLHNFLEVETQDETLRHVEKSRVEKEEEKSRVELPAKPDETVDILKEWNSFCKGSPGMAMVKEITDSRKKKLKMRMTVGSFILKDIIDAIKEQPFLMGQNDRGWRASFDWIIENDTNFIKILERKYTSEAKDNLDPHQRKMINDLSATMRKERHGH